MYLIVGLGNPGEEYNLTRHNTGFIVLDIIAEKFRVAFKYEKKFKAEITEIKLGREKIILAKPSTYMNLSGQAVFNIKQFYKIEPKNIIVIHDDKDIEFGTYKIQFNRGAAGHNGVISIIDKLADKNFFRIRIGIKPTTQIKDTAKFVLMNFTKKELTTLSHVAENIFNDIYSQPL